MFAKSIDVNQLVQKGIWQGGRSTFTDLIHRRDRLKVLSDYLQERGIELERRKTAHLGEGFYIPREELDKARAILGPADRGCQLYVNKWNVYTPGDVLVPGRVSPEDLPEFQDTGETVIVGVVIWEFDRTCVWGYFEI